MAEDRTELLIGNLIAHYRIISPIGKGGMGDVFLAEDTRLGRKVALKLLSGELTSQPERVLRFQQEARAASALNHPNILTIHEIGQTGAAHFMATEFVEGVTLRDQMKRGPVSVQEAVDIGTQIATALVAAHAAGIVHRDIKPENVMIRHDGLIKVLDFGIAKLLQPQLAMSDPEATTRIGLKTRPGAMMGTVSYMSPEQARAIEVDERSDIWSLGVMLYEIIGRRRPFEGPTMSHIIVSILESEPASLATLSPDVSLEIQQVVMRCLKKDRDERYQTMRDVAADLQTIKANLYFEARLRSGAPSVGSPSVPSLVVDVTPSHSTAQSLSRRRKTRSAIDSLAVLPLVNASPDPNMEYLSDGITENIINNLAQVPKLRVVPRNTVYRYKGKDNDPQEIGQALDTRAVLTGRVRQIGNRLTVSVELVDVETQSQLWGEQFNVELTDIFKIQEEIATEIIEKLRLKLSDTDKKRLTKRHTRNTESYQLYLKGRFYWNKRTEDSLRKGIEFFRQAIEIDPTHALAYVGIADSYGVLNFFGDLPPKESAAKATAAAKKALEIDDTLAEVHTSLGLVNLIYNWDWKTAEREFKQAIKLSPNYATARDWYSAYLMAIGKTDDAIQEIKHAQELDPLSPIITTGLARQFYYARKPEDAKKECLKILDMEPNFAPAYWFLGQAYEQLGKYEDAIDHLQQAVNYSGQRALMLSSLGYTYAVSGHRAEAEAVLTELRDKSHQNVPALTLALIFAGLRMNDAAFEWLDKAYEERFGWLIFLNVDPKLDGLRSDPRFTKLLRRLKLAT